MATIDDIISRAQQVRDETTIGANTASRVGGVMVDTAEKLKEVISGASGANFMQVTENGFYVVDTELNIGFCVDEDGCHAINLLEYELVE